MQPCYLISLYTGLSCFVEPWFHVIYTRVLHLTCTTLYAWVTEQTQCIRKPIHMKLYTVCDANIQKYQFSDIAAC